MAAVDHNGSAAGRKVVVAAVQFPCSQDTAANLDNAERLVREAHSKGANVVLLPEIFEILYFCQIQNPEAFNLARPYKGHTTIARFQKIAKELGVVIPVTFFEEANKVCYMSVAVIDADGTDLGLYRKSHIVDFAGHQEKFYFNGGDTGFKVFDTKFGKLGVAICRDQWYPEAARIMALKGAEIMFYPTGFGPEPDTMELHFQDHWTRNIQGLAAANMVPVVTSNRVGKETAVTERGEDTYIYYSGGSFIAGPRGEIVALANNTGEDIVIAEFDLDQIKLDRSTFGLFRDRRPDLYKPLTTLDGSIIQPSA